MVVDNRLLYEYIKLDKEEHGYQYPEKQVKDEQEKAHKREFSLTNLNATNIANNQTLSFNISSTHLKGLQNLVTPAHDEKPHPLDLE